MIQVLEVDENHPDVILKISERNKEEISRDILPGLEKFGFHEFIISRTKNTNRYRILIDEDIFYKIYFQFREISEIHGRSQVNNVISLLRLLKIYKIENGIS